MTKSRPVESDNAVFRCGHRKQSARFKILNGAAVTVQEDERVTMTVIDIMKPNAADFDEAAAGRIIVFSLLGALAIVDRRHGERADRSSG
jgi:hypothetical protein